MVNTVDDCTMSLVLIAIRTKDFQRLEGLQYCTDYEEILQTLEENHPKEFAEYLHYSIDLDLC